MTGNTTHKSDAAQQPPGTHRDPYFDNARGLLIILVVVGHALLLVEGELAAETVTYLYAFHMPAFIYVSGYVARNFTPTPRRCAAIIGTMIVPYLIFQGLIDIFIPVVREKPWEADLLNPQWTMWFLPALVAWRLVLPLFQQLRYPLIFAVAIAVLSPLSESVGNEFTTGRILTFLPFFIAGAFTQARFFTILTSPAGRISGIFAGALMAGIVMVLTNQDTFTMEMLYGRFSFDAMNHSTIQGIVLRIAVLVCGALGTLTVLAWTPRTSTFLTSPGRHTIYIYLLHPLVLFPMKYGTWKPEIFNETQGNLLIIGLSVLLALALGSQPVRFVTKFLVEPPLRWLIKQPSHEGSRGTDAGVPRAGSNSSVGSVCVEITSKTEIKESNNNGGEDDNTAPAHRNEGAS